MAPLYAFTTLAGVIGLLSGVALTLLVSRLTSRRPAPSAAPIAPPAPPSAEAEAEPASEPPAPRFEESLIAVLGHDLRNPLNSISMAHQLLLRKNLPPDVQTPLRRARAAGDRMLRMVDQMLDLTRSHLGAGIRVTPAEMDLAALLREVVNESRRANPGREIDVIVEGDLRGHWDVERLEQVVRSLVGNALTHGAAESPIRVSARLDGEHVEMSVTNEGEIPSAVQASLFDPFRRADPETKHPGSAGLGLGLFIAEEIVRQHGGSLGVTSSEGVTRFVVRLPRTDSVSKAGDTVLSSALPPPPASAHH